MLPLALELGRPWAAALVALVAAVALARLPARGRGPLVLRALLALACALAAGDLAARDPDPPRLRVFVVDRSRSFEAARAAVLATIEEGTRDLEPRDRIAAVAFGATPVLATPRPVPASDASAVARAALAARVDDPLGTDVGAALELALGVVRSAGGAGELVLLSDGNDTVGRARDAATLLAAHGVPLHVVAPQVAPARNARVVRVAAPRRASPGEALPVEVEVEATVPAKVTIALDAGDAALEGAGETVRAVDPGVPARAAFVVRAPRASALLRLRARVALADDALSEDDELEMPVVVGEPRRAVLASSNPDAWSRVLASAGFATTVLAPERIGTGATFGGAESTPDLVVLDDVPLARGALDDAGVLALEALVDAGVPLVVAGDASAFGPGHYAGSRFEKLLPIRSGPPDDQGKPLLLEVVLDASGSMGQPIGRSSRYLAAVEAALPRGRALRPADRIGVVTFAQTAAELQPLAPSSALDENLVKGVRPAGSTNVEAGLLLGLEKLAAQGGRKLLVLVTDGEAKPAAGALERVRAAARAAAKEARDLEVALVFVGEDASAKRLLDELVPAFEGRARVVERSLAGGEVGKLIWRDLVPGRTDVRRTSETGFALEPAPLPAIESYAPVRARELAAVRWLVRDPERGEPQPLAVQDASRPVLVLATSIAGDGGGKALVESPALAELVRGLARRTPSAVELSCERGPGELTLVATGVGREPLVAVAGVGASERRAPLVPEAPGRASARIAWVDRGPVLVRAVAGAETRAAAYAPPVASLELARGGIDLGRLAELASVTGSARGVLPIVGSLPRPSHPVAARRALSGELALAALVLLVIEGAWGALRERRAARRAGERAFAKR